MIGIDAGWRNGVIISRGARTMAALAGITHVVLDKTGTLTTGEVRVSSVYFQPNRRWTNHQVYRMLAAAEAPHAQRHPIAKAVFQYSLLQLNMEERTFSGRAANGSVVSSGIQCRMEVDGEEVNVHVGSEAFLQEHGIAMDADIPSSERTTAVYFAINSEFGGFMALQDTVRDEALSVIAEMKNRGYHVLILTGDVDEEAQRVSKELDIPILGARSAPHQKEASVRDLQSKGHKVVMVGDGINDTLAQAAADAGVLLASSWASNAGAADAMIVSPDLNALPKLLSISKKVTAQAKFNVWYSMAYNVVALALASGLLHPFDIVITPSTAGTLMSFSSVSVLAMGSLLWKRLE
ncbi:HAD-like protein [Eremomyces bilateralis CBS 781.70]|uniref:HAD-like protein n=1 Tax=Eremomyces bilateralis CBS 781.70 TaxID=1392243 RepID=A0A6G1GE65_9PEZI|nr:HAD-like protein [Eremomyces bilateralis CBS 781.70]KAF1816395.1 HAD-like protein [Eremomyces bilateralis CBS 781.70]